MLPVRSVLVDFDGTACPQPDVAEHLLDAFGDPSWPEYDDAVDARRAGPSRGDRGAGRLSSRDRARSWPTRWSTARWTRRSHRSSDGARRTASPARLVSDGFGVLHRAAARAAGIEGVRGDLERAVWRDDGRPADSVRQRAQGVRRLRHVQDARGAAVRERAAGRVRRRGADRPLRRALRRRHVREARAGRLCEPRRGAVRAVERLRRRARVARGRRPLARARSRRASVPDGQRRSAARAA